MSADSDDKPKSRYGHGKSPKNTLPYEIMSHVHFNLGIKSSSNFGNLSVKAELFGLGIDATSQIHENMLLGFEDSKFHINKKSYITGGSFSLVGFGKGISAKSEYSNYLNPELYSRQFSVPLFESEIEIKSSNQRQIGAPKYSFSLFDNKIGSTLGVEASLKIELPTNGETQKSYLLILMQPALILLFHIN